MNNRLKFFILFLFNACLFGILSYSLPLNYESNDDSVMCLIANGTISGAPDCHLVFINAIYGFFLKILYCICDSIQWYTLSFMLLHILSMTIIGYLLVKKNTDNWVKFALFLFVYSFWIVIIAKFQWTTTTAIVTAAGIVSLYDRKYALSCLLFIIASLIRFEVIAMMGVLTVPLIFCRYWHKKALLYICLIPLFLFALHSCDFLFYLDKDWKEYREYNAIRGKVNDNPNSDVLKKYSLPSGLTDNDVQLTLDFYPDPNVITKEKLSAINSIQEKNSPSNKIDNIHVFLGAYKYDFLCLYMILFVYGLYCEKKMRIAIIFGGILWGALLIYVSIDALVKERVFLSSLFAMLTYMISCSDYIRIGQGTKYLSMIPLFGLFIVTMYWSVSNFSYGYKCAKQNDTQLLFNEQIQLLNSISDISNRSVFSRELVYDCSSPWNNSMEFSCRNIILGGWLTKSPLCSEFKSHKDLVDTGIMMLVGNNRNLTPIQKSILDHYNIETQIETISNSQNYKLVTFKSK